MLARPKRIRTPVFSLERAKSIHLMIIPKRVRGWQTLSLLSPASLNDRPRAARCPCAITFDRSTAAQKHRLKNRFSRRVSNGAAG